jgi:hypothetical protein
VGKDGTELDTMFEISRESVIFCSENQIDVLSESERVFLSTAPFLVRDDDYIISDVFKPYNKKRLEISTTLSLKQRMSTPGSVNLQLDVCHKQVYCDNGACTLRLDRMYVSVYGVVTAFTRDSIDHRQFDVLFEDVWDLYKIYSSP